MKFQECVPSRNAYQMCDHDTLHQCRQELQAGFRSGKLKSIEYRKTQILALAHLIQDNETRFQDSLCEDLGRNVHETNLYV
jgi:aldehyde dehydrogenase (NAD+)